MEVELTSLFFWLLSALWALFALGLIRDVRSVPPLPPLADSSSEKPPSPRVSVIMAARDEQERVERAVRRLLEQVGVEMEIVVVDDRSTDRTPAILERLARDESRLRVVRVDDLPERWLGKPHACDRGARQASGEWLLFTDADAWMPPDLIARAVRAAEAARSEHLCLLPRDHGTTLWARAALIHFILGGLLFAARANRDRPRSLFGVGAFNLVRAEAYGAVGGHEPLRMEVLDDVKLGLLLRRAGYRTRVFMAAEEMEVQWAGTAPGLIRAVEKNYFALFEFSLLRLLLVLLAFGTTYGATIWAVLAGGPAGVAVALGVGLNLLPAWMVSRRVGWGALPALLAPLTGPLLLAAVANSALVTLRRGGIRWRDTFYALSDLRRGIVR